MDDDACVQCGSRTFSVENGVAYCENGHDQNTGPEVRSDDEDYGTQGRRIQTKEKKPKQKISRVHRGAKAYRLFLQAYQFILWKQGYALIHEQGLPAELWTVVRDLWTLRLSKLLDKLEEPATGPDSETQDLTSELDGQYESADEHQPRTQKLTRDSPSLLDTVCLCYIAMLLLRLPISLGEVFGWIRKEHLPYFRAIRHIPVDMKDKLLGEYHEALDTSTILRPEQLQRGVYNLCTLYNRSYGMEIPPLNWSVMLYQYVKSLALPLEVYAAAKQVNQIAHFDFRYNISDGRRRQAISHPEAQLTSLVVVATKLLYPFDQGDFQHHPRDRYEATTTSIDWPTWQKSRGEVEAPPKGLEVGSKVQAKDIDVFTMSAQQLDEYMDWYQQTWIRSDHVENDANKELFDMFPLRHVADNVFDRGSILHKCEAETTRVQQVQAALKTNTTITDEEVEETASEIIRPGARYQQFRDYRALNVIPIAKAFHIEAAELSCLSIDMLLRAVLQTERKITLWWQARRRAERFGEITDMGIGSLLPGLEGLEKMTLAEGAVDDEVVEAAAEEDDARLDSTDSNMSMIE